MKELEALIQATREVESSLRRESTASDRLRAETQALRDRHQLELAATRKQAQEAQAREQEVRKQLDAANSKLQTFAAHLARLQDANTRLANEGQEFQRRARLELATARTSYEHLRQRNQQLEELLGHIKPQLDQARAEVERTQAESLEREHRQQAAILTHQGRERTLADEMQMLREQLRCAREEATQHKARWLDTERLKQDAELALRQRAPIEEKNRDLESNVRDLSRRLEQERRAREKLEDATQSIRTERDRAVQKMRENDERLSVTEAQLSKASSEAALLRQADQEADREAQRMIRFAKLATTEAQESRGDSHREPTAAELEMLSRMALPGYPIGE